MTVRENEIRAFLIDVKRIVQQPKNILFINTAKNRNALTSLGVSIKEVIQIITLLDPNDYHAGPDKDHDGSEGSIMIFLRPYNRVVFYIKLKIFNLNGVKYLKVLSFHEEGQYD
ncbi:hypothetical protein MASR2M78_20020 [Treponema sp.]